LRQPPAFLRARSCVAYKTTDTDNPLAVALQRFKYGRDVTLAATLTGVLLANLPSLLSPEVIVPVPLHRDRLRWRGFNQSLLLAKRLAWRLRLRVEPHALRRIRHTAPQVELSDSARQRNVRGAFSVRDPKHIRDRRILLVDDVMTTGATVDVCSRELLDSGASSVEVLTLARALLN